MQTEETSPAKKLASFIAKFDPKVAKVIRDVRSELRKRLPSANELVYDNYNFLAIGFAPTERTSDAVISIAAGKNGVSLCFIHGASLPDPHRILLGSGNQTRFVRLDGPATLRDARVRQLLDLALAKSRTPFDSTAKGRLIIKSISGKQRPRR